MPSRLDTGQRVAIVNWYANFKNKYAVQRQFSIEYGLPAPSTRTIQGIVKRFNETGSVFDKRRSGKPDFAISNV